MGVICGFTRSLFHSWRSFSISVGKCRAFYVNTSFLREGVASTPSRNRNWEERVRQPEGFKSVEHTSAKVASVPLFHFIPKGVRFKCATQIATKKAEHG